MGCNENKNGLFTGQAAIISTLPVVKFIMKARCAEGIRKEPAFFIFSNRIAMFHRLIRTAKLSRTKL